MVVCQCELVAGGWGVGPEGHLYTGLCANHHKETRLERDKLPGKTLGIISLR